jgi:xanthine dehydrogenase large subunit
LTQLCGSKVGCVGAGRARTVVLVDDKGNLRIHAPSTYKIRRGDVPAAFNVSLFRAGRSEEDVIYCSRLSTNPIC